VAESHVFRDGVTEFRSIEINLFQESVSDTDQGICWPGVVIVHSGVVDDTSEHTSSDSESITDG
jgi:hypothetical protein